jgi:hypothetical protein
MSLVCAPEIRSQSQRRFERVAFWGLCCAGFAFGLWQAYECARIIYGYVAAYSFAGAIGSAAILVTIGLLLTVFWRTRGAGVGFVLAGFLSCVTFYAGIAILKRLDRVAWQHESPLVSFGLEQKAWATIYFCSGTTHDQIDNFRDSVLYVNAEPRHAGKDYPAFVGGYLRLLPKQANGHDAVALTLFPNTGTQKEIGAYLSKIESDRRVAKVFTGIAPTAIHLENLESVDANCR